ncbi:hypothetical protein BD779DRAFT_1496247, partial [Infundibulicybe gibba]
YSCSLLLHHTRCALPRSAYRPRTRPSRLLASRLYTPEGYATRCRGPLTLIPPGVSPHSIPISILTSSAYAPENAGMHPPASTPLECGG